jgi:hypothetical protein
LGGLEAVLGARRVDGGDADRQATVADLDMSPKPTPKAR